MPFEWLLGQPAATVQCDLCPKACVMRPGERGDCRIRVNLDGRLTAVTYGLPSAVHIDPIEKKPLNHFKPGSRILSLSTAGCNLHCRFCQNWTLSQADPEDADNFALSPQDIVELADERHVPMVAFTYAEPLAYFEYTLDGSAAARAAGLDSVLVTAGYANPGPLRQLYKVTSAANIDLKAFSDSFYRDVCSASLKPVLDALVIAKEEGVWLEVTNLVIPTLNDDPRMVRDMARWMVEHLGADTPLHLSRFSPLYKLQNLPPTPEATLTTLAGIARDQGIHHVYVGNLTSDDDQNTRCPTCHASLVERRGYSIVRQRLAQTAGRCPECNTLIAGVWK